jgi:chromosome segregation ATPase
MVKRVVLLAVGAVLLLGLFFGRDGVSYVATSAGWVRDTVKDSVPIAFELERARKMIESLGPEISHHKRDIAREELELQQLQAKLDADKSALAGDWSQIERLKDDLARGDSNYVYVGRSYTAQQVETDLTRRFERYETREATVEKVAKILEARRRGLEAAQEKLKAMIADKRQLEVEVENLVARMKMVEVAKAASEFNIDDSQLSRTRQLLSDIEARIEVDAQLVNADDLALDEIPLEQPAEDTNILDRITEYETAKDKSATYVGVEK